jgi:hypothetical protein
VTNPVVATTSPAARTAIFCFVFTSIGPMWRRSLALIGNPHGKPWISLRDDQAPPAGQRRQSCGTARRGYGGRSIDGPLSLASKRRDCLPQRVAYPKPDWLDRPAWRPGAPDTRTSRRRGAQPKES